MLKNYLTILPNIPLSIFVAVYILFGTIGLGGADNQNKKIPCASCEKLTFNLKWSFIPVGKATLEILPSKIINGVRARHFLLTARTNDFADTLFSKNWMIGGLSCFDTFLGTLEK